MTRVVTERVRYTEQYRVRVAPFTRRVRVAPFTRTYMGMETYTYTVRVRVAPFTERVRESHRVLEQVRYVSRERVAPFTKRVRVAPLTRTVRRAYRVTQPYCAVYDVEFGVGCLSWKTRTVTKYRTSTVAVYNYVTRAVFNYRDVVRYRPEWVTRYRYVTRQVYNYRSEQRTGVRETLHTEPVYNYKNVDVFNYETREREVCCRLQRRTVTETTTVRERESAVPDASCMLSGYALSSGGRCVQPAGARLADAGYACRAGWTRAAGDSRSCERTLYRAPRWVCPAAPSHTLDTSGTVPVCRLAAGVCPPARLGALASGSRTLTGTLNRQCRSERVGSAQSPHWARSWTFTLTAQATLTAAVSSTRGATLHLVDTVSGAAKSVGGRLAAGSYLIEVAAARPRTASRFTLTLTIAGTPAVVISGLADATAVPRLGATTAAVSTAFAVDPADAACTAAPTGPTVVPVNARQSASALSKAAPAGTTVAPATGRSRTVTHTVPEGTTVTVTVTCAKAAHTATARAKLTATNAPVQISGLDNAVAASWGAPSVAVTDTFEVTPHNATCAAKPAAATVAPTSGRVRTVTLRVAAGTTATVTVTCANGTQTHTATAQFTATPFGRCDATLGSFGAGTATVHGSLSPEGNCRTQHGRGVRYARRHTLTLAHPGWVTITATSTQFDTYLRILRGATRTGRAIAQHSSKIDSKLLPAGAYTIEVTTRQRHSRTNPDRTTGAYTLTVTVDHTPRTNQPAALNTAAGTNTTTAWAYQPATAELAVTASSGVTANLTARNGKATLNTAPTRTGAHTVTVAYANGPHKHTQKTAITAFDGNCPPTAVRQVGRQHVHGHRARQPHYHLKDGGHLDCRSHTPPACKDGPTNMWNPGVGHRPRNIDSCTKKNRSGIIDNVEQLPWSPYDVDTRGNPVICEGVRNTNFATNPASALQECLRLYNLTVFTWNSGFDLDTAIREYEQENNRRIPADVRNDLVAIAQAIENKETILMGTQELPRRTGSKTLDDAILQVVCEGIVDYAADKGASAAAKKVGAWAKNRFPTGRVFRGAIKLGLLIGLGQTILEVTWSNLTADAACD